SLDLLGFDRPQCLEAGDGLIADIQFPQRSYKADGSARSVELKLVFRWLCKVNISSSSRQTRPSEAIGRTQRAQLRKISSWVLAECRLPILRERTGAERKKGEDRRQDSRPDENRYFRVPQPFFNRLPFIWAAAFHSYEKNTREFSSRVFPN